MTEIKERLDNLVLPSGISSQWPGFKLKWAEHNAGFDIFDLTNKSGGKLAIGDDADYLHLFMAVSDQVYQPGQDYKTLLIASDTGGKRLFIRHYSDADRERFKYAYIALGNAVKQLPDTALNQPLSFFAEINLEKASAEGFEKEARKAARTMSDETRKAWESLIETRNDFLKTDLYVFQLLKLYSWGFKVIGGEEQSPAGYHFVRAKRPQPRGASRH